MMESSHLRLLQDLAMVMLVAGVVTLVFHRLRQPVVLGYILAGLIIGPHTPPFPLVADQHSISTLADLGVMFLMFSLGLQFSLRTLREVGTTAVVVAALEVVFMLFVGYQLGQLFGWSRMDSLFLGAMVSITSTTIIVRTLQELGLMKAKFAQLIFGIQIVEDTLGMTMVAVLSAVAVTGQFEVGRLGLAFGNVALFLVVMLIVGLIFVPPLLRHVARYDSDEMLLITVIALCFGVTLVAAKLGHSIVLGAFVIGTIIGETREIGRIKQLTEPVRDMFSAVFFVTIGMMINPALLLDYAGPILIISAAVVVGKIAAFSGGTLVTGHDARTALRVGTCMVPVGELSFIIASLGMTLGVTSEFLYPIAVSVSALTMPLTPYLARNSDRIVALHERHAPPWLVGALSVYSRWIERLRVQRPASPARRLVRRWIWQMALNMGLATAMFALAPAIAGRVNHWWPQWRDTPSWLGGAAGMVWLLAALIAMPALIATVRKLNALAMLLSELSVGMGGRPAARAVVQNTIYYAGVVGVALWILLLSATVLPMGPGFWVLLVIIALVTAFSWRFFIQIHAKGQAALQETLATPPEPAPAVETPPEFLLRNAELERLVVTPLAPAAGKRIGELHLRAATGASIVAIEREDGSTQVNPGPDEELRPGDKLLLLGTKDQLAAARLALTQPLPTA